MGELVNLPSSPSRWFADSRGRSLKATWHAEAALVVISLWESYRCIGTFRLAAGEAPDLIGLLADAVKEWAQRSDPVVHSADS